MPLVSKISINSKSTGGSRKTFKVHFLRHQVRRVRQCHGYKVVKQAHYCLDVLAGHYACKVQISCITQVAHIGPFPAGVF
uniref:Transposase n=1 Tax=Panagrellus redivivus TaxID=6233 RepID=A0A7E4V847_PANRE